MQVDSHVCHNSLIPSFHGVVERPFHLEYLIFYLLPVHLGPYVGHFMEHTEGKRVHHVCGQSYILGIYYIWFFSSFPSICQSLFFLIKKAKNPRKTKERIREPSPKMALPLFSCVMLSLMSTIYQPPGHGEGLRDTVYKNTLP